MEAGVYLIIPTTFHPSEECNYSLRIFTNKTFIMRMLDHTPQMLRTVVVRAPRMSTTTSFVHYEPAYMHLADERKTIDAFGLQELLDFCLPNDYVKSCASLDTCRQLVLTMDVSFINVPILEHKLLACAVDCT